MAKEDLIGAWDLVSMEARHSDGTVTFPLGEEAVHDTVRAKIEQDGGPVRVAESVRHTERREAARGNQGFTPLGNTQPRGYPVPCGPTTECTS